MNRRDHDTAEFDKYAGDYDALLKDPIRDGFAASRQFFVERKIDIIRKFHQRIRRNMRALRWLDVGCGQGDMLRLGQPHFASAAGCDPSQKMLDSCAGMDVRLQTAVDELPYESATFDFVTVVCVYHHVPPDRRAALTREAIRILRPGGDACIVEHNPWNPATRLIVSRTPVDADARLLYPRQTRRLMRQAGAEVQATRYFLLFPERIHQTFGFVENLLSAIPLGGQYAVFARKAGSSKQEAGE